MERAKRNAQVMCNSCPKAFYAKGLCKSCYMVAFRGASVKPTRVKIEETPEYIEGFWQFVKAELRIG